ncbi:MAG: adenosylcobinamide-GDP ribazoletransferase [Clostridiales bacterium]|nr:adenosylcobinamide-GDP ribazoletransferase [Clostridiales bacterium]
MSLLRSFLSAFSMFSTIPLPTLKWREDNMRYMMALFPFVGVAVGLVIWAWLWVSETLGFGAVLRSAGLTLLPVAVTGGIHLDGFCDTADALASRASQERKREILKDPHTGAFAVIGVVSYLLLYFALGTEIEITYPTPLLPGLMFVLSRTLSGLAVLLFPANAGKGLLSTFKDSAGKKASIIILVLFLALSITGLIYFDTLTGIVMTLVAIFCLCYIYVMSRRQFGGMSGDLAGYFLQLCELMMLASIIIIQKVVSQ